MPTADHEIDLKIQQGPDGKPYAALMNMPAQMKIGETVHFRSANGLVIVKYNKRDQAVPPSKFRSPFVHEGTDQEKRVVRSTDPPLKLSHAGNFLAACSITPVGSGPVPSDYGGGGNTVVRGS